jgi:hypothetical protein
MEQARKSSQIFRLVSVKNVAALANVFVMVAAARAKSKPTQTEF